MPEMVPVNEYWWNNNFSWNRVLTCKNHQTARYSSKNPWQRSLIITKLPEGDIPRTATGECTCPFGDLVVIVDKNDKRPE